MARRSLKFTVDREPIDLELGGEHYAAPAILAPATMAQLLDQQSTIEEALNTIAAQAKAGERGAIDKVLHILAHPHIVDGYTDGSWVCKGCDATGDDEASAKAHLDRVATDEPGIFDLVLDDDSGDRFRRRLYSRNSFDLMREVMPAVIALVEEYTGRPTRPSLPSANGPTATGTSSTAGAPAGESTPAPSPPTASAI
jgi:hypothetical protein